MRYTIQQIAEALDASFEGNGALEVSGVAEPSDAGPAELALAMSPKYAESLSNGQAQAAVLWEGADWAALNLKAAIFVTRPRLAMAGVARLMDKGQGFGEGIHPTAVIADSAKLGADVSVGAFTVIGENVSIGDGAVIGPHCVIGQDTVLGQGAFLREMVSIGARVQIGARFIAQPGARIGSDGFSFVTPEVSGVENARKTMGDQGETSAQSWLRINSLGSVTIGDDVEIGANCTIDNGTVRNTEIGSGTKLDNLVHVGHNVRVGRDCLLCGQAGISGSVDIGNNVVLGGQTGVADNLFIGDRVIAGGACKILSNVPAGRVVLGYPAVKMDTHTDIYKAQRRLPRLMREFDGLKKAVSKLTSSE